MGKCELCETKKGRHVHITDGDGNTHTVCYRCHGIVTGQSKPTDKTADLVLLVIFGRIALENGGALYLEVLPPKLEETKIETT